MALRRCIATLSAWAYCSRGLGGARVGRGGGVCDHEHRALRVGHQGGNLERQDLGVLFALLDACDLGSLSFYSYEDGVRKGKALMGRMDFNSITNFFKKFHPLFLRAKIRNFSLV